MYGLDLYDVKFQPVLCVAFCLSSRQDLVSLVSSFRYNGLGTLALAGPSGPRAGPSGPLRALRAHRADASGCAWMQNLLTCEFAKHSMCC